VSGDETWRRKDDEPAAGISVVVAVVTVAAAGF